MQHTIFIIINVLFRPIVLLHRTEISNLIFKLDMSIMEGLKYQNNNYVDSIIRGNKTWMLFVSVW